MALVAAPAGEWPPTPHEQSTPEAPARPAAAMKRTATPASPGGASVSSASAADDATQADVVGWGVGLPYPTLGKGFVTHPASRCDGPGCLRITPRTRYLEGKASDDPREGAVVIEPEVDSPATFARPFPDAEENPFWLDFVAYRVNYNARGVLDITYMLSGTGAYSWSALENRTHDANSGRVLKGADVFRADRRQALLKAVSRRLQRAIQTARAQDPEAEEFWAEQDLDASALTGEALWDSFAVTPEGVTFFADFGFPNVVKAFTPCSEYPFTWSELKPYLRTDGPLWTIARAARAR